MDLQKLRALVALDACGSYSEAAERLYTTQSNVSKQIQALERELAVQLVDRSRRRIALTWAGERAVARAKAMLGEYDALLRELAVQGASLRIGCLPVMAHYGVPALFAAFQKEHPVLRLEIEEVEGRELLEALSLGRHDLAICRLDRADAAAVERLVLFEDRLIAVLPEGHPLAARERLSLRELEGETFLLLGQNSTLYDMVLQACNGAGFSPRIGYCGHRMENILAMVEEGAGVTLMMEHAVSFLAPAGVRRIPLRERVTSNLALVRPRQRYYSPAAGAFWEFARGWVGRR